MSQPWSSVHLKILLYLAWQKTGHYKDIEQAWSDMAPDTKKSLRAITDRLLSIPKDVEKIGLQKYFEEGPPPTRRKSTASSKGISRVKSKLDVRSTIQAPLPLSATEGTNENSVDGKYLSRVDGDPYLSNDDDEPTVPRGNTPVEVLSSTPKEDEIGKRLVGRSLRNAAKRPSYKYLLEDDIEDDDSIQGPSKRHKSRDYVKGEGPSD